MVYEARAVRTRTLCSFQWNGSVNCNWVGKLTKETKGEQEVKDILYKAERDDLVFEEMTVTEFKELYPVLRIYSANQIGVALKKQGILTETKWKDGKTQKIAKLPRPKQIIY